MDKYTILPKIKRMMKKDDNISRDQIKDYNRRIARSPVLRVHLELLQSLENERIRNGDELRVLRAELNLYKQSLSGWKSSYDYAKKIIMEEFGKKSYEYEVCYGLGPMNRSS